MKIENKNSVEIDSFIIKSNLKRLVNQTYKLLPYREEKVDWQSPLFTIIEELFGLYYLINSDSIRIIIFSLICKLKGLNSLTAEDDFPQFRRSIFECLTLINTIIEELNIECQD